MLAEIKALYRRLPIEMMGVLLRIFQGGIAFLIAIFLGRLMGPESYGKYALVVSWLLLGGLLAQVGLPNFLVREISVAKHLDNKADLHGLIKFSRILTFSFAALVTALMYFILSSNYVDNVELPLLLIGLPYILLLAFMSVNEAIIRGFGFIIVGQVPRLFIRPFFQLLSIVAIFVFVGRTGMTPSVAMWTLTLSTLAAFLTACAVKYVISRDVIKVVPNFELQVWRKGLEKLSLLTAISAVGASINVIILGFLSSETQVGFYAVCSQFMVILSMGLNVINAQQGPELSAAYEANDKETLQRLAVRACRFSLLIAFPVAIPFMFFGNEIMVAFFDVEYVAAAPTLAVLTLGQIFNAGVGSVALILVSARMEKEVIVWQCLTLLLQLLLLIVLCPMLGAVGAAIATSIGLAVWNIALLWKVFTLTGIISMPIVRNSK